MSDDYEVGYKRPPKHSQFVPGQSGNKGRKKVTPSQRDIIRNLRDEVHEVGGKKMSSFELAGRSVITKTIKSGKPADLKILMELFEKYGGLTYQEEQARAKEAGDKVVERLMRLCEISSEEDEQVAPMIQNNEDRECSIIEACPTCAPRIAAIHQEQRSNPALQPKHMTPLCTEMEEYRGRRERASSQR